jgi:ATP-binding cassette subfamily B protein
MSFIFRHLQSYRRKYVRGLLFLVATNGLALTIPWLLKSVIETIRDGTTLRVVSLYALAIAAVAITQAVVRTRSRLLILGASRCVVFDVRNELYAHLQTLPASFYDRHRTGEIMSRAVNDLRLIRSLFGPGVLNVLDLLLLYPIGLTMMALIDPTLMLVALLPYPFLLFGVYRVSRVIHQRSNAALDQLAEISNKVQENLSGLSMVKAYRREVAEIDVFDALSREYRSRSLALARSRGLIVSLMIALGGASTILVLWLGGRHAIEGQLTLGGLYAFIHYLGLLTRPTIMMGWMLSVFQRGLGAIRRVEEIHAETSDLPGDRVTDAGPAIRGAIAFRGLTFAYPNGRDAQRPALTEIDLEIPAGTLVGVVGRVGAGKSSLVRLLAAVHAVPQGTLIVDGRDLNDIPTAHLRRHVAVVPQESFLFSKTIAENVALGFHDAPRERIESVASIAQLTRDLPQFTHGLDTMVGERGVTLSGGQRQRVALARALLLDPRILILDDALSSVDADTEEAILEGLREFMRGRTTFLISHRVATVMDVDLIVALEDGRIVETGPPRDLLRRDGSLFGHMVRQQQIEREMEAL